ncbi:hypothetical protein, partial [Pseudomonas syringae]|uniref:hypothetical protein n=1 Tax=Pseudomonas syringae TaxID=317 RepID=UPI000B03D268
CAHALTRECVLHRFKYRAWVIKPGLMVRKNLRIYVLHAAFSRLSVVPVDPTHTLYTFPPHPHALNKARYPPIAHIKE